jgi:hypothetical protein
MSDFIPKADDTLTTWLTSLKTKLATHAATLGIAPADVSIYQAQCDALIASIADVDNTKKLLKNKVSSKDQLRSDVVGNLRTLANRIKNTANYTAAIGNDLGIVGTVTVFDAPNAKPTVSITLNGGHIVLAFDKQKSNGVKIYSKRGEETAFSFLALDTHSPYHDNRPSATEGKPEKREYYAYYIDTTDDQFGPQSDVVSVVV